MATQRYISTSFWDDEWVSSLDPSEKLLYLYFMTNPLTNIAGIYETTIRRVCFDTGFNTETTNRMILRFNNDHKLYYLHGYVIIPSWPKHQKWEDKQTIRKGIDSILSKIPKKVWYDIVRYRIPYAYPIDKILIDYGYDPSYLDLDLDLDLNSDIDSDIKNVPYQENSQPFETWRGSKPDQETPATKSHTEISRDRIKEIKQHWKSLTILPQSRALDTNTSYSSNLLDVLNVFPNEDIIQAMNHLSESYPKIDAKYRIKSFSNFMTVENIEKWYPDQIVKGFDHANKELSEDDAETVRKINDEVFK